jgi:hypothetical protein
MCRFFLLVLLLPGFVLGMGDDSVMNHHVNVITGKMQLSFQDHLVHGAVPLALQRSYTNYEVTKNTYPRWSFTQGWSFLSHTHLYINRNGNNYEAEIIESSGGLLTYVVESFPKGSVIMKPKVHENQNSDAKSYRANENNSRLILDRENEVARLELASGGIRLYKMVKEEKTWGDWFQEALINCSF